MNLTAWPSVTWQEAFQLGLIVLALAAALSILIGSLRAGISPMPSSRKVHQAVLTMLDRLQTRKKRCGLEGVHSPTLIDCGSGWGNLALKLARRYPDAQVIGYELSLIPWLVSRLLARFLLLDNLTIYRKSFMGRDLPVPLSQGDVLFTYLHPRGMKKLAMKLRDPLKASSENQQLISIYFALPGFKAEEQQSLSDLYQTRIYRYPLYSESSGKVADDFN